MPPEPNDAPTPAHPHLTDAQLASRLMKQQAALGMGVAAIFMVLILGLPLLTHFAPAVAQTPVFGFPFSWFLLGIAFYPITWALSAYFVKASEKLETEEARMIREEREA